ncbi:MAG: thermonuclease family protein [Zoogloeaceae bacterium]|nr:thermonuclease family protein [Zoogloeaceae bacterium]
MVLARVFVVGCLLAAQTVSADFSGKVVGVSDGDTITVLKDRDQVKVRLVEIDAPEKGQAYGNRSKQTLSELVLGKQVEIRERGTDRYGRTLGRIYQSGLDVNAEMVRRGMAWVYVKYAKDQGLYQIQAEAREQRRELWADKEPVPPWEWRRARKTE